MASVSGIYGAPNHGAYGAAKAGAMDLVRTMAQEWGHHGIRVNAVAPDMIATPRVRATYEAMGVDLIEQARKEKVTLGRFGEPKEIAGALVFLVSDLSNFITGQTIIVDGGVPPPSPTAASPSRSKERVVKLDLLYEFQPKIKPWDKPHPYGQRRPNRRPTTRASRRSSSPTPSASRRCGAWSTTSATALRLPVQRGGPRRVGPVDQQHPPRLRRRAHASGVPASGPGRREGGDRRHPEPRPGRVGHRALHADGAVGLSRPRR